MKQEKKETRPKERRTSLQTNFGKIIRKKRLTQSLSQEKLAELANMHFTYVSSIERGERNVSLANIAKLAKALKCSMKELMPD
jgi:transcriptional regulator with XRE-family HTH domain